MAHRVIRIQLFRSRAAAEPRDDSITVTRSHSRLVTLRMNPEIGVKFFYFRIKRKPAKQSVYGLSITYRRVAKTNDKGPWKYRQFFFLNEEEIIK